MFFTWVARARSSRPPLAAASPQSRATVSVQHCLRLPAEARSISPAPARSPKYQIASTASCLASSRASAALVAGDDVDDAGGHVGGVEDLIEVGRDQRLGLGREHHHRVAGRHRRAHQRDEGEEARLLRTGDADHADRLVHGERQPAERRAVDGALVLVRPGGEREEALDRRVDLEARLGALDAAQDAQPIGELGRPGAQILGDVVEDLRPGMLGRRGPAGALSAPPRRRCGCPCGCPRRPRRRARRSGSRSAANSRRPAAAACRRYTSSPCGRWSRREAPARGRAWPPASRRAAAPPSSSAAWCRRQALRGRPRGRSPTPCSRRSRNSRRRGWSSSPRRRRP